MAIGALLTFGECDVSSAALRVFVPRCYYRATPQSTLAAAGSASLANETHVHALRNTSFFVDTPLSPPSRASLAVAVAAVIALALLCFACCVLSEGRCERPCLCFQLDAGHEAAEDASRLAALAGARQEAELAPMDVTEVEAFDSVFAQANVVLRRAAEMNNSFFEAVNGLVTEASLLAREERRKLATFQDVLQLLIDALKAVRCRPALSFDSVALSLTVDVDIGAAPPTQRLRNLYRRGAELLSVSEGIRRDAEALSEALHSLGSQSYSFHEMSVEYARGSASLRASLQSRVDGNRRRLSACADALHKLRARAEVVVGHFRRMLAVRARGAASATSFSSRVGARGEEAMLLPRLSEDERLRGSSSRRLPQSPPPPVAPLAAVGDEDEKELSSDPPSPPTPRSGEV